MSAISNFLPKPPDNFSTNLTAPMAADGVSFAVDSATGLGTEGVGVIFKKDAQGDVIASSLEFIHWTGVSGNTIQLSDTDDRGLTGSAAGAQAHDSGDYFEVWVTSHYYDGMRTALLVGHTEAGAHEADVIDTAQIVDDAVTLDKIVAAARVSIMSLAYPVGSIYMNIAVNTNPATLLGFGTWVATGVGKVLVGIDGTDTDFDTAGETGGSKTTSIAHTHTMAHTHTYSHTHTTYIDGQEATFSGVGGIQKQGTGADGHYAINAVTKTTGTQSATTTSAASNATTSAMSANATPSIVQPYEVVYMWKRTA